MEPIVFNTLDNVQNIERVARVFSNGKPPYELKPQPYMVILVGSPGVGKTTKAKEFLKRKLQVDYDKFYNISLDSLVERVKPYRIATKALHNTLKARKGNASLNNQNYSILSEPYLSTIMSKNRNFKIPATMARITRKIEGAENVREPRGAPGALKSLNDLRKDALIYGVINGMNILYDTTLLKTRDKVKADIMPVLEMNKNVKYKIVVILVSASEDAIKGRLAKRHKEMLEEADPYIRAVPPKMVARFIEDNKVGFDKAREYFEAATYERNTPESFYNKNDFTFIEIDNPPLGNYNNTNNFKYF
jgi:dephospho-CoA kinase